MFVAFVRQIDYSITMVAIGILWSVLGKWIWRRSLGSGPCFSDTRSITITVYHSWSLKILIIYFLKLVFCSEQGKHMEHVGFLVFFFFLKNTENT